MIANQYIPGEPDQVIIENMKLVKKAARRFYAWIDKLYIIDKEDLHSIGCLGLIRAYEIYDPNKSNIAFSTYAFYRICTAINRYLYDFNPTLSFPRRAREVYYKIMKNDMLEKDFTEISEALGLKMSDVIIGMEYYGLKNVSYTSTQVEDHEDSIQDLIISNQDFDSRINMMEIMELISNTQKKIFYYHFIKDYSQSEISIIIGMGQPNVSRNIKKIKEIVYNYLMGETEKKVS